MPYLAGRCLLTRQAGHRSCKVLQDSAAPAGGRLTGGLQGGNFEAGETLRNPFAVTCAESVQEEMPIELRTGLEGMVVLGSRIPEAQINSLTDTTPWSEFLLMMKHFRQGIAVENVGPSSASNGMDNPIVTCRCSTDAMQQQMGLFETSR
eukprot:s143_g3.t1